MNAVARTASGFAAVGVASGLAAVWTSSDGRSWLRVPDDPIFHPRPDTDPSAALSLVGVAANRERVVAAGQAFGVGPGGAPAALGFWSPDGRTWTEATVEDPTPDYIRSVTATADGFLATGSAWHDQWLQVVWSSSDGRAWRVVSCRSRIAFLPPPDRRDLADGRGRRRWRDQRRDGGGHLGRHVVADRSMTVGHVACTED